MATLTEEQYQELKEALKIKLTPYIPHVPHETQHAFLWLQCLEALYGGAAGGGKSDALLMAALQYVDIPGYNAILFRKTYSDLNLPGSLIPRSHEWLNQTDAKWNENDARWTFPSGATLSFGYMRNDEDRHRYQSAEFQLVGWDELTHFSLLQYTYMFSRVRKPAGLSDRNQLAGVPLRVRGATNPGGRGHLWVKNRFIKPMGQRDNEPDDPRSRVFIPAKLEDNPSVDAATYLAALSEVDDATQKQLIHGDWDAREPGPWVIPDPTWIDAAVALGAELWESGNIPRDMSKPNAFGIDWGEFTQAYIIWPLVNGGVYIPPSEVIGEHEDPATVGLRILRKAEQTSQNITVARYDAAGIQAQALDTPLPTPSGWTTMGDVEVGDLVFDEMGLPTKVLETSPVYLDRACFEIEFDDGSTVVCDGGHQWLTQSPHERMREQKRSEEYRKQARSRREKRLGLPSGSVKTVSIPARKPVESVRDTYELLNSGHRGDVDRGYSVKAPGPLQCAKQPLLIHPYVLGAWLGDGLSRQGAICCHRYMELLDNIRSCGFNIIDRETPGIFGVEGLCFKLKSLGLLGNKHIPLNYLRASMDQRKDLLRGLMDTDGTAYKDHAGRVGFSTTKPVLRDGFGELLSSLGIKWTCHERLGYWQGIPKKMQYRFTFTPTFPVFAVRGKKDRQSFDGVRNTQRYIVSVRRVASVPVRCIYVESESHLFLCGHRMVPTHNSMRTFAATARKQPGWERLKATKIPFGKYKRETINYLRLLFKRAAHGRKDRYIAIHPANVRLIQQLRAWQRKDDESEDIEKVDDHGPDAVVAGVAPIAAAHRAYIEAMILKAKQQKGS